MYRAIITPKETTLTIELPNDLVGKPIEILAFDIEKTGPFEPRQKPSREEIKLFYQNYNVDITGFKFNREEANER